MTAKEKFDNITDQIEDRIRNYEKADSIAEKIATKQGLSKRDLSTVFCFLTGLTLDAYIKERKMNASYKEILKMDKYSSYIAVDVSGCADQPTYTRKFKKLYGMTPTEACEKKDAGLVKTKLLWDELGNIEVSADKRKLEQKATPSETLYGLTREKAKEIEELLDLKALHNFDESKSELAYEIYLNNSIPLVEAFGFVDECLSFYEDMSFSEDAGEAKACPEIFHETIRKLVVDPEIAYVYFACEVYSIESVLNVIEKLHDAGEYDVTQVDKDVVWICACYEIEINYCKRAVDYFKNNATDKYGREAFEEYVDYVLQGIPMEVAFEMIDDLEVEIEEIYTGFVSFELEEYENDVTDTFTDFSVRTDNHEETWYDYSSEEQ